MLRVAAVAVLVSFAAIAVAEEPAADDAALKRAKAALDEPAPDPLPRVDPRLLAKLSRLPQALRHRTAPLSPEAANTIRSNLAEAWCSKPAFPEPDVAPKLTVESVKAELAPISDGFAAIGYRMEVKPTDGVTPPDCVPILVLLNDDGKITEICRGITFPWWQSFVMAELETNATKALIVFISRNREPIPANWKDSFDGKPAPIGMFKIDRAKLAAEFAADVKAAAASMAKAAADAREAERIASLDLRNWGFGDGRPSLAATFIGFRRGVVTVRTADGDEQKLRLAELDDASKEQLRELVKRPANSTTPADTRGGREHRKSR